MQGLRAQVRQVRSSPWAHDKAVDLQQPVLHFFVDLLPQVLPQGRDLAVRDNQDVGVAPLLRLVPQKRDRPADRLVDVGAAIEAAPQKFQQALHGIHIGGQLKLLDLVLSAESDQVALSLLLLGPPDALEDEGLGNLLPIARHGGARVQTKDDWALHSGWPNFHPLQHVAVLVVHPAHPLVAQQAPLHSLAVPQLFQDPIPPTCSEEGGLRGEHVHDLAAPEDAGSLLDHQIACDQALRIAAHVLLRVR
mmetsp:Transcript_4319/g.12693  ORF Transcript_4319/g.12693 Transcript_4319/m.12693 type:complete len:249 (-) Transcript_4319:918-1664(-)